VKEYLLARLSEASTWRGIIMLATAAGVVFTSAQAEAVIAAGLALAGLVGAFSPDSTPEA
jgi:hypothetical protein